MARPLVTGAPPLSGGHGPLTGTPTASPLQAGAPARCLVVYPDGTVTALRAGAPGTPTRGPLTSTADGVSGA